MLEMYFRFKMMFMLTYCENTVVKVSVILICDFKVLVRTYFNVIIIAYNYDVCYTFNAVPCIYEVCYIFNINIYDLSMNSQRQRQRGLPLAHWYSFFVTFFMHRIPNKHTIHTK